MKSALLLAIILIFASVVLALAGNSTAQEPHHAPTVDVCRADVALWFDDGESIAYNKAQPDLVTDGVSNRTPYAKLGIPEVRARLFEMNDCMSVDAVNLDKYHEAESFYHGILSDRIFRFVIRHGLMPQVLKEDAEGKR